MRGTRGAAWIVVGVAVIILTTGGAGAETTETTLFASCTAEPTSVAPGDQVTLDASNSDANYVEFDPTGNGTYSRSDETDFTIRVSYDSAGTYEPAVRADGDSADTDSCGTVIVEEPNQSPSATYSISPRPGIVGETVTVDASASVDEDGQITAYRWDFDGDGVVEVNTSDPVTTNVYDQTGAYGPTLTVRDDDGGTDSATLDFRVERPVVAVCSVTPTRVGLGENVTIDGRESDAADFLDYDVDGDGEYDVFESRQFVIERRFEQTGTYAPRVRVYGSGQRDTADCGTVTVRENEPPIANLSVSPNPATVGESITFDAGNAVDSDGSITEYRWDFDADGTVDETTDASSTTTSQAQADPYVGRVTVVDDDGATASVSRDYRVTAPPTDPVARCSVGPEAVTPGDVVTIDARESEGAELAAYDLDGDGSFDRTGETTFVVETSYDEPGTYSPAVRVSVGDRSDTVSCGSVTVREPNEPPTARFGVDPVAPSIGQSVVFDASNATDADGSITEYRWDVDGDGTIDQTTNDPRVTHTYTSVSSVVPTLTVVDDDGATGTTSRDLVVSASDEPTPGTTATEESPGRDTATEDLSGEEEEEDESGIPWIPIVVGSGGLLGLGGLAWHVFGNGGGGGSGNSGDRPTPKPKPKLRSDVSTRYETGVFEIPSTSGTVTVPVGFESDLLLFSATNGARTDTATDRTAGQTRGVAHSADGDITNQCLTVADDAHTTDQATAAVDDDTVVQVVRHQADDAPGRVTARVTDTTADGFEFDVSVPGDDPIAGGIRVLYQAFRTGPADVDVGHFRTPTEPGTQTVDLDVDADHVSLSASAAVTNTDQLWTTDRGVGLTIGTAVEADTLDQTSHGTSAWPGGGYPTAATCRDDRGLSLLYQDGETLAGRTSARVADLGETLRLRYDRVYNGPQKLGSTARHPVSYLAVAGGEELRPAVGAFKLPRAGESHAVDCGFEPGLIEVSISPVSPGEEAATGAMAHPFGFSQGSAIVDDDRLRQYVLHHAVVPDPPAARALDAAPDAATAAATDGGKDGVDGDRTAPVAAETGDDGRAGLWLVRAPDGTIVGRDELRVTGTTETGFEATVDSVDTDNRDSATDTPTVLYRAWPATDQPDRSDPAEESAVTTGETDQ